MKTAFVLIRGSAQGVQRQWGGAFAEGLQRHGINVETGIIRRPADLLVVWGVRQLEAMAAQRKAGGEIVVLERGYLGDRFKWTSVSFGGGLNGRGIYRGTSADPARFDRHFAGLMKAWRHRRPDSALLIGQVPGDMSLTGVDIPAWYAAMARQLQAAGFHVKFREHPRAVERGVRIRVAGATTVSGTLEQALAEVGFAVTFNSNAAVDAVLAGVPTMTADPGSMAWDVTSHSLAEGAIMPDRQQWAARLAWKQWSEAEMQSGECWAAVGGAFREAAA